MCLETSQGASRYQQSYYSVWAAESSSVWFRSFQSILSKVWLHPLLAMRWLPICLLRITVKNVSNKLSNTYKLNYYVPNCKNQMQWKKNTLCFTLEQWRTSCMKIISEENIFRFSSVSFIVGVTEGQVLSIFFPLQVVYVIHLLTCFYE